MLALVMKWVGVALLVVACLLAVYLGAVLLGELAVWATYPRSGSIPEGWLTLEEQAFHGNG